MSERSDSVDGDPRRARDLHTLAPGWTIAEVLHDEDFDDADLSDWRWELEQGGSVRMIEGVLDIEVPAGATVWFTHELEGPLLIEYDALSVKEGGPNDRVSDLNCFWMARDARSPDDIFATERSGRFADYNQLLTYYVGLGGNRNTTTRFRRYIGDPDHRPMLPEHDLDDAEHMLSPNTWQTVQLIAAGGLIRYARDGRVLFVLRDDHPYTSGWFAIRTTYSHLRIDHLRISRLAPVKGPGR
ncbi:MAG: Tat pathway signal sequence domain protein [Phycisphaeraceae bacterium]|nr:MAG: Tat pathway signal sequence domain protein [Phycisphaeraceae bacterium]